MIDGAEAMLETDVPGVRTFAIQVKDNSMEPLFSEGEVIFVNPDLPTEPGQYVLVDSEDGHPEGALLRQLKEINGQTILASVVKEQRGRTVPRRWSMRILHPLSPYIAQTHDETTSVPERYVHRSTMGMRSPLR
jgi:SOS-response transcriptional repressor LexA